MNFFAGSIGQDRAIELLSQAAAKNRIAPAYLFSGPSGVGRALVARCFSELLICKDHPPSMHSSLQQRLRSLNHPDFLWIQPTYLDRGKYYTSCEAAAAGLKRKAPPQIRIEQIRELDRFLANLPLSASRSVVVIEEAQTMTESAANALLKTLEEPGRATIILIALKDSLLPTLVSRCQQIPFYRLSEENLKRVLQQRGYEADPELLKIAQGSPGEVIAAIDRLGVIPRDLLAKLKVPPARSLDALELAKQVDKELDTPTQLWLVDYLQQHYWYCDREKSVLEQLEKVRTCLLAYVQPRLVWECALLNIGATLREDAPQTR